MGFCCCVDFVVPYAGRAAASVFCLSEEQEQDLPLLLSCLLSLNLQEPDYLHTLSSLTWLILMDSQHAGEETRTNRHSCTSWVLHFRRNPESRDLMARDENSVKKRTDNRSHSAQRWPKKVTPWPYSLMLWQPLGRKPKSDMSPSRPSQDKGWQAGVALTWVSWSSKIIWAVFHIWNAALSDCETSWMKSCAENKCLLTLCF